MRKTQITLFFVFDTEITLEERMLAAREMRLRAGRLRSWRKRQ